MLTMREQLFLSNEMDRNEKIKSEALQDGTQQGVVD